MQVTTIGLDLAKHWFQVHRTPQSTQNTTNTVRQIKY